MSPRGGRPEALGAVVPRLLRELGLEGPARAARLAELWPEAVGREIAAHSAPVAIRGDTLDVEVDSSVWCQQLSLRSPEILEALRAVAGEEAPESLRFRLG